MRVLGVCVAATLTLASLQACSLCCGASFTGKLVMSGQKASQPTGPLKPGISRHRLPCIKNDAKIVADVLQDTLGVKSALCSFFMSTFFEQTIIAEIQMLHFHGHRLPTVSMQNSCVLVAILARRRPPTRSRPRSCVLAHTVSAATVRFLH